MVDSPHFLKSFTSERLKDTKVRYGHFGKFKDRGFVIYIFRQFRFIFSLFINRIASLMVEIPCLMVRD